MCVMSMKVMQHGNILENRTLSQFIHFLGTCFPVPWEFLPILSSLWGSMAFMAYILFIFMCFYCLTVWETSLWLHCFGASGETADHGRRM